MIRRSYSPLSRGEGPGVRVRQRSPREPPNADSRILTNSATPASRQDVVQYMPMHIGQAAFNPVVVVTQSLVIEPQQMQQRRMQLIDR